MTIFKDLSNTHFEHLAPCYKGLETSDYLEGNANNDFGI